MFGSTITKSFLLNQCNFLSDESWRKHIPDIDDCTLPVSVPQRISGSVIISELSFPSLSHRIRPTLSGLLVTEPVADPSYGHEGSIAFTAWYTPGFASAADSPGSTETFGTDTRFEGGF